MAGECTHWTVDKKVPLALIITLVVQTGGVIWWASTTENRMGQAETAIIRLESKEVETRESRDRLIRLEERMIAISDDVRRALNKMEALIDGRTK
ncbi:hypothetical protein ACT6QG_00140 [Xanthobacter sp. TB0136]|uniref:hypothetical protein n=1 Tax=Xanthobacter sp. TB0136 TaxID=3459177 RepID=UPI0040391D6E